MIKQDILLVDDDSALIQALTHTLSSHYNVYSAPGPTEANLIMRNRQIPVVILDLNLPEISGLDLLKQWQSEFPETEVVFCSGEQKIDKAMDCIRHGAADFISKPFKKEDLLCIIQRTFEKFELKKRSEKLNQLLSPMPIEFVGKSPLIVELLNKIKLLKNQPHLNVILLGESGTGKEIMARLLHQQDGGTNRPFVVVNMPAIPTNLMEAELFGVEKGAYTDAKQSRPGKFELADGGDIFLDEIGDLPLDTQAKLLRTLQEKQIERIGSNRCRHVSFRVISATNQPLSDLMSSGQFREDVIYRLSDMVLWLPPLRDRKEDIPILADYFIKKYSPQGPLPQLSEAALNTLLNYSWPGNVRQLESTVKRALVFCKSPVLEKIEIYDPATFNPVGKNLTAHPETQSSDKDFELQIKEFEKQLIISTLKRFQGDKNATMSALKLPRATFYRKLSHLGLIH